MVLSVFDALTGLGIGEALKDFVEDELKLFNSRNRLVVFKSAEDNEVVIDGFSWPFPVAFGYGISNRLTSIGLYGVAGDADFVGGPGPWNISMNSYIGEIIQPLSLEPIVEMEQRLAWLSSLLARRGSFNITHEILAYLGVEEVIWKSCRLEIIEGTKRVLGLSITLKQAFRRRLLLNESDAG